MSEFNPLVQRVDALLKRHQQNISEVHQPHEIPAESPLEEIAHPPLGDVNNPPVADESPQVGVPPRVEAIEANPWQQEAVTMTQDVADDADIPLLTEIVDPAAISAKPPEFDQEAFGEKIEAAVLDKLLAELDKTLDQRLGRTITDLLEQVLHGLRAELSVSVRQMVREAVATAVAREMGARARRP